jgi:hypothetical protein
MQLYQLTAVGRVMVQQTLTRKKEKELIPRPVHEVLAVEKTALGLVSPSSSTFPCQQLPRVSYSFVGPSSTLKILAADCR